MSALHDVRNPTNRSLRHLLLASLLLLLALLLSYQLQRTLTVDVGSLWDIPFVSDFNADEADIDYRYRWSKDHSEVFLTGVGSAKPLVVSVWAQGVRFPGQTQPVTMSVSLNGQPLALEEVGQPSQLRAITLTEQLQPYRFGVGADWSGNYEKVQTDNSITIVSIDTSAFRPPGDARALGAKIDRVELLQNEAVINWPPLWAVLWSLVTMGGLFGILSPLPWRFPVFAYAGTLLLCAFVLTNRLYFAAFLPPIAAALGLLGLLIWQRERVSRWPEAVEALRTTSPWASFAMAISLVVYAAIALSVIPQVDFIGHADYAENAVIARNLVSGKGFTVDYMAQFYRDYGPALSHPADTWPLLQPLMIAPFFALFGTATWVAKLPNLFVLLGLAWAVYHVASRLWDSRVGLLAGLLVLVHPYFFNSVLYPINDMAFALIFFVLAWLVWRELAPLTINSRFPTWTALSARIHRRTLLAIGALSGLLIWSKPSGAVLLAGLALSALWVWWRSPKRLQIFQPTTLPTFQPLLLVAAAALLVLLPLIIRNLLAFGAPFYSTESYDAWILRYWPLHDWEDIYKFYIGSELPHPRWLVGGKFGYDNLVNAVQLGFQDFWQKGILSDPTKGDYIIGLLPLSGAILGVAAAARRVRGLFALVSFALALYALFVLLYWHFEGRYFQVALPWIYMLLAYAVFWLWDRLRFWILDVGLSSADLPPLMEESKIQNPKSKIPLLVLPLAIISFLWPSISSIREQNNGAIRPVGFVTGMKWLKDNSAPQDVVMTRDPWELNWHTGRKAVMIPNDDLTTIEEVARKYGVTILQLGGPVDGIDVRRCPNTTGSRSALGTLYCGEDRPGYELLYRQGGLTIYRLIGSR